MTKRELFLIECMKTHGTPYIWGGSHPQRGIDCSGLAQHLLATIGLDPLKDQTAHELARILMQEGALVGVDASALGDLVFYGQAKVDERGRKIASGKITHVGIALGNGLMIEAAGGGSSTTSVEIARKQGASVRVSAIKRRSDLVCIVRPKGLPW